MQSNSILASTENTGERKGRRGGGREGDTTLAAVRTAPPLPLSTASNLTMSLEQKHTEDT